MPLPLLPLPVDGHVGAVRDALASRRAAVLTASPGAGKTTRIPPELLEAGPVVLLQPRRVAARAVARRIADERGWTVGREVGWHIRFERQFTASTRLLVVTEGVLTARLQDDPLLTMFSTVIFDEFHERSIHADLGLALARQAWLARSDLRICVMSATLDVGPVAAFLDDCPVVSVPGDPHPLEIRYQPETSVADAVCDVWPKTTGSVLCFLPGRREVEQARADIIRRFQDIAPEVVPLHGSLEAGEQDAAIGPVPHRRVIVATNVAETSLTVPGVTAVVDSGLVKVASYDAERGIDSLNLERVTLDSADQRAGRAARVAPGIAVRLWDVRDRLRLRREPDIARVDLSSAALDVLAWGGDPRTFAWFEPPDAGRLDAALRLLQRLGAIEATALTPIGRAMLRLGVHPRLGRILVDGRASQQAAAACALLSERGSTASDQGPDFLRLVDGFARQPPHIRAAARELQRRASAVVDERRDQISEKELRRAMFAGYADRLARRRAGSPGRLLLASGHGASLPAHSPMAVADFLVAADVVAGARAGIAESKIRSAVTVEPEWIRPTATAVEHRFDETSGRVRAFQIDRYDAIILEERPVPADPAVAAGMLTERWLARPLDDRTAQLLARIRFAGIAVDRRSLVASAAVGAARLDDIDLAAQLPFDVQRRLGAAAPETIPLPSGRSARLRYLEDGSVSAAVKLQELFGLADSPRIGPSRVPVTIELLAPNGRAVQTTRDLKSFWTNTYPEVRRELRGRYPKHLWPDNPWTAVATHRTKPRAR